MKAVILCAGKGKRMQHLTLDIPKPLLMYKDKTLIEHKLHALPDHINDVVLVVGHLGESIRSYFGDVWHGEKEDAKKIQYVEQTEMLGTAHALIQAKHLLDEPFIVLMGDDLYDKEDLALLSMQKDWAILVENSTTISEGSQENGRLMTEEDKDFKNFAYTGACFLTPDFFNLPMVMLSSGKEYGLPQTFASAVPERAIKIFKAKNWKRITTPEDLE
jgi:NDP-sugar pyrophosphorylase family protein